MNTRDGIKEGLEELNHGAVALSQILNGEIQDKKFTYEYQTWYTKAIQLISFLAPDRASEFRSYYEIDPKRKSLSWGSWVTSRLYKRNCPLQNTRL